MLRAAPAAFGSRDLVAVFVHYLNPDLLNFFGAWSRLGKERVYCEWIRATKHALLVTERPLLLPASYLFEVPYIDRFLNATSPVRSAGLMSIVCPTASFADYASEKVGEYRSQPSLFPGYETPEEVLGRRSVRGLGWEPRIKRSASREIANLWRNEIRSDGVWERVLRRENVRPSDQIETRLAEVPDRLDGRAFVSSHAFPLLPIGIGAQSQTELGFLIQQGYLLSYLDEFNATILSDLPIGAIDVDLSRNRGQGGLPRTISLSNIRQIWANLGALRLIEEGLPWGKLVELKFDPRFSGFHHSMLRSIGGVLEQNASSRSCGSSVQYDLNFDGEAKNLGELFDRLDRVSHLEHALRPGAHTIRAGTDHTSSSGDDAVQLILSLEDEVPMRNRVFLVHGRDTRSLSHVKSFLGAIGLTPVSWEEAVRSTGSSSPHTLDVISKGFEIASAAVILFTPDDNVFLRTGLVNISDPDHEKKRELYQARPNVLVEVGMALALYRERTVVVEIGSSSMRPISDLEGINVVRFDGSPQSRTRLVERLKTAQCDVVVGDGDYLSIPFEPPTL